MTENDPANPVATDVTLAMLDNRVRACEDQVLACEDQVRGCLRAFVAEVPNLPAILPLPPRPDDQEADLGCFLHNLHEAYPLVEIELSAPFRLLARQSDEVFVVREMTAAERDLLIDWVRRMEALRRAEKVRERHRHPRRTCPRCILS
jgi:hypothetical protein